MTQSQRILKNVLAGGISSALGGFLQLLVILIVAHHVSVSDFGSYSFMLAFAFILQRLSDLGVGNIVMRDMAVAPNSLARILGAALALAWIVTAALTFLMLASVLILPLNRQLGLLTVIMGIAGASQFQCGLYGATLRSQEDNELQALGFVLHKIILLALISASILAGVTLPLIVLAHLVSNLCQWGFYRWLVIQRYARPKLQIDTKLWKYLMLNSVPIGASGVIRLLGEQADILILTWLTSPRMVGLFSGPYKIAAGLRFVPQAMMIAAYPHYARAARTTDNGVEFSESYERGLKGMLLLAVPIALVFVFHPHLLAIGLLGRRYATSAPALRLLSIGVFLLFIASPFPFLITALNRQRMLLISSAIALVIRVSLDFVLTPHWGFVAPCFSLAVSESVLLAMWIGTVWRAGFPAPIGKLVWRIGVACVPVVPLVYAPHPHSLMLLVPEMLPAMAVYLVALIVLGVFSSDDLRLFRESIGFVGPFVASWSRELQRRPS
jgi:O-antigen/teichoic acid export membrane protein